MRMSKLVNEEQNNWDLFTDDIAYSINTQKQSSTKHTPYLLLFGFDPNVREKVPN